MQRLDLCRRTKPARRIKAKRTSQVAPSLPKFRFGTDHLDVDGPQGALLTTIAVDENATFEGFGPQPHPNFIELFGDSAFNHGDGTLEGAGEDGEGVKDWPPALP
jgi:hypothetical protein